MLIELVDDTNPSKSCFQGETNTLAWMYATYLKKIALYKILYKRKIRIAINNFIKEDYIITTGTIYDVSFRYNPADYIKLNDEERKQEINELYYKYLYILFEYIKLPTNPLKEIYNKIIENNYEASFYNIKETISLNKKYKAALIVLAELKRCKYILKIKNAKTKELIVDILLFNTKPIGVFGVWFFSTTLHKIKWINNEELQILSKTDEVVYTYNLCTKTLHKLNISDMLKEVIIDD